jgi:hypothetical protein
MAWDCTKTDRARKKQLEYLDRELMSDPDYAKSVRYDRETYQRKRNAPSGKGNSFSFRSFK